jgi:hypothetical protein
LQLKPSIVPSALHGDLDVLEPALVAVRVRDVLVGAPLRPVDRAVELARERQQATKYGCRQILLPKAPPMSCVTKRSLSIPTRSAGAIQIAPTPGHLVVAVHRPLPGAAVELGHAAGALERRREKRSKCSSEI